MDPTRLPVDAQIALLQTIELAGTSGIFADLVRVLVCRRTDPGVRTAALIGRRSAPHVLSFLAIQLWECWTDEPLETAVVVGAIMAMLPRLSARNWARFDWHTLRTAQRCTELGISGWTAPVALAVIERLHDACVAPRHAAQGHYRGPYTHRWMWTRVNLERWLMRFPGADVPGGLVAKVLASPDPEIRAWAFAELLPRAAR